MDAATAALVHSAAPTAANVAGCGCWRKDASLRAEALRCRLSASRGIGGVSRTRSGLDRRTASAENNSSIAEVAGE